MYLLMCMMYVMCLLVMVLSTHMLYMYSSLNSLELSLPRFSKNLHEISYGGKSIVISPTSLLIFILLL